MVCLRLHASRRRRIRSITQGNRPRSHQSRSILRRRNQTPRRQSMRRSRPHRTGRSRGMKLYGIAYRDRMGVPENAIDLDHVVWEENREIAIAEYNQRDDKHWDAALIMAEVSSIDILHDSAWRPE